MKIMKRFAALAFVLILMVAMCAMAFAEEPTFTVRIYAGNIGSIDGGDVLTISGIPYGGTITVTEDQVTITDSEYIEKEYHALGFRESGHDNDPIYSFGTPVTITRDMDFVIGYGMWSKVVQYVVAYKHAATHADLLPTQIFYGNVGDKPVVAYQYVEKYKPQAPALTKTLVDDATQNLFIFYYTPVPVVTGGGGAVIPAGGSGGAVVPSSSSSSSSSSGSGSTASGSGTAGGAAAGNPGTTSTAPAGTNVSAPANAVAVDPVEIVDLDVAENAAAPGTVGAVSGDRASSNEGLFGLPKWVTIGGGVILAGLVATPIVYFATRKKKV